MSRRRIKWAKKWHAGKYHQRRKAGAKKNRKPGETFLPSYHIPAGTDCFVRKLGTKTWRPHRTKVDLLCHGYLWRNEGWYGFSVRGEWETKVKVGLFREGNQ